jgi:hypothetical protein
MVQSELLQFQSIIDEQAAARLEMDRVLIRGHVPERYQAVQIYVLVLEKCIAELEAWSEAVGSALANSFRMQYLVYSDVRRVMPKILSEITFTKGERKPGYRVMLEDGTFVFYTNNGLPVSDVGTHWLLAQEIGEFETAQEFEALAGVRPIVLFELCGDCGLVRMIDGPPCSNCQLVIEANPGLELIQ